MKAIDQIVKSIQDNDKIALFHHNGIDGDSWSCSYGLLLAIKSKFPKKEVVLVANEEDIEKQFPWLEYDRSNFVKEIDNTYLAIVGDTASQNKLDYYDQVIRAKQIVCFDHHKNPIDIKHDIFWSEPNFPASAIQAYMIAEKLGVKYNEEIAFNMLIGLLTDTGNFAFSLGNPDPVLAFGNLLKYVSDQKMDFFWSHLRHRTKRDIELEKLFIDNTQFDGRVAYVYIDKKQAAKFRDVNIKSKLNTIANIEGYPIWGLFIESEEEGKMFLKLHLRSTGPDVSSVTISDGSGGGHERAAGGKVPLEKNTLKDLLKRLNNL